MKNDNNLMKIVFTKISKYQKDIKKICIYDNYTYCNKGFNIAVSIVDLKSIYYLAKRVCIFYDRHGIPHTFILIDIHTTFFRLATVHSQIVLYKAAESFQHRSSLCISDFMFVSSYNRNKKGKTDVNTTNLW